MAVRVTQTFVENIIARAPPPLRVTQTYIENIKARALAVLDVALATETDSALALQIRNITRAVETDSAFSVEIGNVDLATETDTALALLAGRSKTIGLATETDTAFSVTSASGEVAVIGLATETDSALSLLQHNLGLAEETDTALPIQALVTGYWPFDDLKPRHIGIHPCAAPIGGGVALTGREPVIDSGRGYWRIAYGGVYVNTRDRVFLFRQMEARFEGRGRAILIPIYDGKRAPWVTVGGAISVTANAAVAQGATSIVLNVASAGTIAVGQHFSAGHYLYRIKAITVSANPLFTCTIWPKTREAIAAGTALEFARPRLRVRLAQDNGMAMALRLLRFGDANIEFVEDVP